jgi:hypothetical protein
LVLSSIILSCTSGSNIGTLDIRSPEDSVIFGRLRFLPGPNCTGEFKLPAFELANLLENTSTPFVTLGSLRLIEGQTIEIPIARRVNAGSYEFRMKTVEAPPQSAWLDAKFLALSNFAVAPGQLAYFGTLEVTLRCEQWNRQSATHYVSHIILDESQQEFILFREQYPEIFQLYKDRLELKVPGNGREDTVFLKVHGGLREFAVIR